VPLRRSPLDAVRGALGRALGERRLPPIAATALERRGVVDAMAAELVERERAAPITAQVVVGDSGAGKTTVLMALAARLSAEGQVVVAVSLRGRKRIDLERLAHDAFVDTVTSTTFGSRWAFLGARAKNAEQAEAWWNWLRRRDRITLLADDLEKSKARLPARVRALEQAERIGLPVAVATRGYGLPGDYRRGRSDLGRLRRDVMTRDLRAIARHADRSGELDDDAVARVVGAEIGATPYYLALARVLAATGALAKLPDLGDPRLALLDGYRERLADGTLMPNAGLRSSTRAKVLRRLEVVAFVRMLGEKAEETVVAEANALDPPQRGDLPVGEAIDLGRRLAILESRHDGQVHFAHPTTLAYFASRYVCLQASEPAWRQKLAKHAPLSPPSALCLVLAAARDSDSGLAATACGLVLDRLAELERTGGEPGSEAEYERLSLCGVAVELMCHAPKRDAALEARVIGAVTAERVYGTRLTAEKQRVVKGLGRLRAYRELWAYAGRGGEYPVRREAAKVLAGEPEAHETIVGDFERALRAAEHLATGRPRLEDDDCDEIANLKPVAWILPSLRQGPAGARGSELDDLQRRLIALACEEELSVQRGLEASVAQGFKLAALSSPGIPDAFITSMLHEGVSFWFSHLLLLQALTLHELAVSPDRDGARGTASQVRGILELDARHEHPFVRETARLCLLALRRPGRCRRYVWADATDVVTRVPDELSVRAAQLVGDIVIALNLNGHEEPRWREAFGTAGALPACLGRGTDRTALLGYERPPESCPLRVGTGDGNGGTPRCECPYLYHSTDLHVDARREFSRAFCRHQRRHARRLPWQPAVSARELKSFWREMEELARY
jgi:ABC-type oligopeptide transport system ATPase subunit